MFITKKLNKQKHKTIRDTDITVGEQNSFGGERKEKYLPE